MIAQLANRKPQTAMLGGASMRDGQVRLTDTPKGPRSRASSGGPSVLSDLTRQPDLLSVQKPHGRSATVPGRLSHGSRMVRSLDLVGQRPDVGCASGRASHVRPSRSRPPAPLLEEKRDFRVRAGVPQLVTHEASTGRAWCPLSPPAISQSTPLRSRLDSGPSSGSAETKRTTAGTWRRSATRRTWSSSSTLTPIHTCLGQGSRGAAAAASALSTPGRCAEVSHASPRKRAG
jgi:hypothetical protein